MDTYVDPLGASDTMLQMIIQASADKVKVANVIFRFS